MSTVIAALVCLGALAILGLAVLGLFALMLPSIRESSERVRIEREAQQMAWQIHQQAVTTFARMLEAARERKQ